MSAQNEAKQMVGDGVNQIGEGALAILLSSKMTLATFLLSSFMGYGISFILFDYRIKTFNYWTHIPFHCIIGLGYTALIFVITNFDIFKRTLSLSEIIDRMPFTLVVSLAVGFVILLVGGIVREFRKTTNE